MGGRLEIVLMCMFGLVLIVSDARIFDVSEVGVMETNEDDLSNEIMEPGTESRNEKLCTLCEEFAAQAVEYLSQNKTQTQIIDALHKACSQLHSYEQQCLLIVDYYAPLFFMEIDLASPEEFCKKVNLCERTGYIHPLRSDNTCSLCQEAIIEILLKIKDPDNQLELVGALLKACDKMESFAEKCKRLVFEYGPVILVNVERFLETTDVCTYIRACKPGEEVAAAKVHHYESEVSLSDS